MKIGIVDADLIGRDKHNFPNLVCEKLSAYHKSLGDSVELLMNYEWVPFYLPDLSDNIPFDRIYISKVFTDTPVPKEIDDLKQKPQEDTDVIRIGGTGFYFDKAPNLPEEIEHHMPDYHLYDGWVQTEMEKEKAKAESEGKPFNKRSFNNKFKYYLEYSIGFTTRGCFRQCGFCVNQKYKRVNEHSPLHEFYDSERPKICLLDDNILGYCGWRKIFEELQGTGKQFVYKQGLDERLLTEENCKVLFSSNYDKDYLFAFDNVCDYDIIHEKLKLIRKYNVKNKGVRFYVLVGFKSTDAKDIEDAFRRIELLLYYKCMPYIMRYRGKDSAPWETSKYRHLYVAISSWCNQPNIITKKSFREFCEADQAAHKKKDRICSTLQALMDYEKENPEIAKRYFDVKFGEPNPNIID